MARQTFQVGQYVMWRKTSRPSRWDKREGHEPIWSLGIVGTIVDAGKRVYVRHAYNRPDQIKSIHSLQFQDVRNQIDTIRPATIYEVDAAFGAAMWRCAAAEEQRKTAGEQRAREEIENLERGWKRLHEALGNHTDGAIVTAYNILEPLIDTDALRRYGAKAAVSA